MRILPVNLFKTQKMDLKNNYVNNYSYFGIANGQDTIHFSGLMTAKKFSAIGSDLPDLYTGGAMLTNNKLKKMKERGFFQGPISDVVKKLGPYKDKYLTFELRPEFEGAIENIELKVFERIEKAAKETPDIDLTQLFRNWYEQSIKNLRAAQKPYFDEIKTLGAELPQNKLQEFYNFMMRTDRQLYDVPIHHRFSIKEFKYQTEKILEKIPESDGFKKHINHQLGLLSRSCLRDDGRPLTDAVINEVFKVSRTSEKHISRLEKDELEALRWKKEAAKINILSEIKDSAEKKGLKRLERLCDANIKMIQGQEALVPFSNKAFNYDLQKMFADIADRTVADRILAISASLPNSTTSVDAFIIKLKDADPNTIGDRIFSPALKSIEHITPASHGGESIMTNCALARKGLNTLRSNAPLWTFLRYFPVENQYKYAMGVVKLNHKKKVPYIEAYKHLSKLEKEGHLDLTRYKDMLKDYEPSQPWLKKIKNS